MATQNSVNSSNVLDSKAGKALIGILCLFIMVSTTCAALFFGGIIDVKNSVPEKTTETPITTPYVHPMFKGVEKKGYLYDKKPKSRKKKNRVSQ